MKKALSYLIAFSIFGCSKYHDSDINVYTGFDFNISDSANVNSDGKSLITLVVTKTIEAKPDLKVILTTNKGNIITDNLVFNGNVASTYFKVSQDTGLYIIKAVVKNATDSSLFQKTINFSLNRAWPEVISLEPNRTFSTMSADTPTILKTYLTRNIGLVTIGTPISFRSYQLNLTNDTIIVGRFEGLFNNLSKIDGTLNDIKFFSDTRNIDSNRVVTIEARSNNITGIPIIKNINLRYK